MYREVLLSELTSSHPYRIIDMDSPHRESKPRNKKKIKTPFWRNHITGSSLV